MSRGNSTFALRGTEIPFVPGATAVRDADPTEMIEVGIHLRSRNRSADFRDRELAKVLAGQQHMSREEWAEKYGAAKEDLELVSKIAREVGLSVGREYPGARMIFLSGTSAQMEEFLGVKQQLFEHSGGQFIGHQGNVHVPEELAGIVECVSGLHSRKRGEAHPQPQWIFLPPIVLTPSGFLPTEVAKLYDFPEFCDGSGQTIGVIEMGGGILADDLQQYCTWMKTRLPKFTVVAVRGKGNDPGGNSKAFDGECTGDIETIAGVAPGADIVGYFTDNSNEAFLDAVKYAIHDQVNRPSVISVSWGDPESTWADATMQAFNQVLQEAAVLGVTVCCAAGDFGSSAGVKGGGLHVCFPASSPYALACGGTSLFAATGGNRIEKETVWNNSTGASGGGFSNVFPLPDYQQSTSVAEKAKAAGISGRGMPDVASDGDPKTGFMIRVNGKFPVGAGTSAAAPVWAGLIARINQKLGRPVGFLNPVLYQSSAGLQSSGALRAITVGNNGAYQAGPGWNACTGFGTPDGAKLMDALVAAGGTKAIAASN